MCREKETKGLQVIFLKDESCFVRGEDNDRPERSNETGSIVKAIDIAHLPFFLSLFLSRTRERRKGFFRETASGRIADSPLRDPSFFLRASFLCAWRSPFPRTSPINIWLIFTDFHPVSTVASVPITDNER